MLRADFRMETLRALLEAGAWLLAVPAVCAYLAMHLVEKAVAESNGFLR